MSRQRRRRIDRVEQQLGLREHDPRHHDADADETHRHQRHGGRGKTRQQQHESEPDGGEIDELRAVGIVGPLQECLAQHLFDDLGVDLHARHRILGGRIAKVLQSDGRRADEHDVTLDLVGRHRRLITSLADTKREGLWPLS